MIVSHESENSDLISEGALALFLEECDGGLLTDVLVQSLEETLRILRDEVSFETVH